MISVYQAGPIDACTDEQVHDWRDNLKKSYPEINWLDPTIRSYESPCQSWRELVDADLKDIGNSDALLAYCWQRSSGTSMELVHAQFILHIPVFVVVDDLSAVGPWIQYHADYVTDSFEDAVKCIKDNV